MITIVGAGLAGTLAALEAERNNRDFVVVDQGAGATATRAAAGLFNPLTGPRFTPGPAGWNRLNPFYRELEQRLGVGFFHPIPLWRPWTGAKVGPQDFPRRGPGWKAEVGAAQGQPGVWIEGGGWIDLPTLLDAALARWQRQDRWEDRRFSPGEGRGQRVLWAGGLADFTTVWAGVPSVDGRWQGVRGDVLPVNIPGLTQDWVEVGPRFLLPLSSKQGQGKLFRWGATHESDVVDQGFRPEAKTLLERELHTRLQGMPWELVDHRWGVRPASRTGAPLVIRHPDEAQWTLFNGFGGRGTSLIPLALDQLVW